MEKFFGPMPLQAAPLVLFVKQFACDAEHGALHLSMLAEHLGEGLRCLRSWTGPDGNLMLSVAYAWNDAANDIDLVLKGHYDDPALLEASFDAIDDFARSIRMRQKAE